MPAAMEMAQGICELAPLAARYALRACWQARLSSMVPSSVELAHWQEFNVLPKTEDIREGYKAFAEKRKPIWKGK